jgi:hypothetical protein
VKRKASWEFIEKEKEKKNIEKIENQRRRKTECEEKWARSYTRAPMRPL